ncbi:hypothetical protein AGRA3207_003492 [Actinomadura graeca]|uniref:Uncharacterized protein n=1 Tax=Actinomadura graeca TaxID=2750812 RepID=A0ABX8QV24_9ACTN|nr:hypothetical protein [Actinomadura graeca]QXJ22488.1 hypothetical protein AGRA3207_003492 [Actinomadura graeca]
MRHLTTAVLTVSLGTCLAARCEPVPPSTQCSAKSCTITIGRASTRRQADRLDHGGATNVIITATGHLACEILAHALPTQVVCEVTGAVLGQKMITSLRRAARGGDCLRIHFRAPTRKHWRAVSSAPYSGPACTA